MVKIILQAILFVLVTFDVSSAVANGELGIEQMAMRLIELRSEVERASQDVEAAVNSVKAAQQPSQMRRQELEGELARLRLRRMELEAARSELKRRLRSSSSGAVPPHELRQWLEELKRAIAESLPFRREERMARLEEVERQLKAGQLRHLDLARALFRLTEHEIKLVTSTEYAADASGKPPLELVRLGRVALLTATPSGELGYWAKTPQGWSHVQAVSVTQSDAIKRLFSRFKANHRTGWIELPSLPQPEVAR